MQQGCLNRSPRRQQHLEACLKLARRQRLASRPPTEAACRWALRVHVCGSRRPAAARMALCVQCVRRSVLFAGRRRKRFLGHGCRARWCLLVVGEERHGTNSAVFAGCWPLDACSPPPTAGQGDPPPTSPSHLPAQRLHPTVLPRLQPWARSTALACVLVCLRQRCWHEHTARGCSQAEARESAPQPVSGQHRRGP